MALAAGGVLVGDAFLAPYYPCLFALVCVAGLTAPWELRRMLPAAFRPRSSCWCVGVLLVLLANWATFGWEPVLFTFVAFALLELLVEMLYYEEPGLSTARVGVATFGLFYLGLLPSFFVQIRWLGDDPRLSSLMLAATIFVPKVGDIGAYFTGRFLGRHRFSPLLSPKKTWEGFAGGLCASLLTAVALSFAGPIFRHGIPEAVGFGLTVGVAGVLGDLAESMVKRDCQIKDAGGSIPGFGGLLDVIDSILFAGPVAYWWFSR
jgi:phosphatidate cytidylyltransferase